MKQVVVSNDIAECVANALLQFKEPMESSAYVAAIVSLCEKIASCVFFEQVDIYGKPLAKDIYELAKKSTDVVSYCAVVLQHAIKYGKEKGFTFEYIEQNMNLPLVIKVQLMYQLQEDSETWSDFINRLSCNSQATKAILRELVHYADITKYHHPTKTEHIQCSRNLERAMVLKTRPSYYDNEKIEPLRVLDSLSKLTPMNVVKSTDRWILGVAARYYIHYSGGIINIGTVCLSHPVKQANDTFKATVTLSFNKQMREITVFPESIETAVTFNTLKEYNKYASAMDHYIKHEIEVGRFNKD